MGEDDDIEGWKRVWSAIEARLLKIPMSKADLYRGSLVSPRAFANMRRYGAPDLRRTTNVSRSAAPWGGRTTASTDS